MAIDTASAVPVGEQGETTMRPNFIHRFTVDGDDSYPTGGSAAFSVVTLLEIAGKRLTANQVTGFGLTAGAITHFVNYDKTNDKLLVYLLSTGAEVANAVDLSTVSFDLTVLAE